ncbi:MAG: hypothetical protein IJJ96_03570, partial [Bacteroidales bacterium]|nr:hypothetical protein [Bacteroidales bacterium]
FKIQEIKEFCSDKGIAMFDTATAVRRLKDNASDKFLEVVEPTDIPALLREYRSVRRLWSPEKRRPKHFARLSGQRLRL